METLQKTLHHNLKTKRYDLSFLNERDRLFVKKRGKDFFKR
jgi:hypothetical protein